MNTNTAIEDGVVTFAQSVFSINGILVICISDPSAHFLLCTISSDSSDERKPISAYNPYRLPLHHSREKHSPSWCKCICLQNRVT